MSGNAVPTNGNNNNNNSGVSVSANGNSNSSVSASASANAKANVNTSNTTNTQPVSSTTSTQTSTCKQGDSDSTERFHHQQPNRVKQPEHKPSARGRFGWVKRLMQGQNQNQSQNQSQNHTSSGASTTVQKQMNSRRVRNGGAVISGALADDSVASYNSYYGNYSASSRKNSGSTLEQGSGKHGRRSHGSNNRHSRTHSTGKMSGAALTVGQHSATSVLGIASTSSCHDGYDARSSAGTSEMSVVSFIDGDGRSITSGMSSFESNDVDSDNFSTIPLKSITLGTSTATREPSILSNAHRNGVPSSHYVHYSHYSTAATINTAATSTSTASITQGLGIDGLSAHEPSTAPSIMTNTLTVPSVSSPMDTESIITLASSSRRMRRRSIDTNCSTNGIPPASIFERLSVYPRENMRDSDAYTTTTAGGGGSSGTRITATTTACSTPSSTAMGSAVAGAPTSHASTSKPGSLYASSVVTSNNEGGNVNESPATASLNETSVGA